FHLGPRCSLACSLAGPTAHLATHRSGSGHHDVHHSRAIAAQHLRLTASATCNSLTARAPANRRPHRFVKALAPALLQDAAWLSLSRGAMIPSSQQGSTNSQSTASDPLPAACLALMKQRRTF